ncbi:MAG TPA: hypothetical protein VKU19_26690 [Bryobacteraceae bacterium]|nr:hypothetical protein [Bryobacteraceae bacterium]
MKTANQALLCVVLSTGFTWGQTIAPGSSPPKLRGETASGKAIELPEAAAGKVTLLIIGFSKTAGEHSMDWEKPFSADFSQDSHVAVYAIAMLERVPGLVRGMVKSSIRKGRPKDQRDNMVMTTSGETEWRQFCGVTDDKVPYLVLLDGRGHTRWSGHGLYDRAQYDSLLTAVRAAVRD